MRLAIFEGDGEGYTLAVPRQGISFANFVVEEVTDEAYRRHPSLAADAVDLTVAVADRLLNATLGVVEQLNETQRLACWRSSNTMRQTQANLRLCKSSESLSKNQRCMPPSKKNARQMRKNEQRWRLRSRTRKKC